MSKKGFGELIKEQVEILYSKKLALLIKYTINKHITKIEVIVSSNVEYANLRYYEGLIRNELLYEEKIFELKKERVYEKGYGTIGIVVYSILSNRKKINSNM